jgi:hypothetical protein
MAWLLLKLHGSMPNYYSESLQLGSCYATPIIQIFQDGRYGIKIDPQLESTTQPKARGLLHMECDFATVLPYNLNFKTDELDHLPASRQFKYY